MTAQLLDERSSLDDRAYKHREDLIDACLAAWTAALWTQCGADRCQVLGEHDILVDDRGRRGTIIAPGATLTAPERIAGNQRMIKRRCGEHCAPAILSILRLMSGSRVHKPVRLGMHGGKSVFEQAAGLHEPVTGMAVVGSSGGDDPEVMFEEHGQDATCDYFDILVDKELDESIGATEARPETRERIKSSDERIAWTAMRAAFLTEQPAFVNQMIRDLKQALEPNGGAVTLIQVSPRFQRRIAIIRMLHTAQAQPERSFAEILGGPYPLVAS